MRRAAARCGDPGRQGWRPPPAPPKTPPGRPASAQARAPLPPERCASPAAREEAEEQEEEAPPSPRRAPSPLSALRAGPVWRSCSGPAPPRCATSLSRSRPRRSAG